VVVGHGANHKDKDVKTSAQTRAAWKKIGAAICPDFPGRTLLGAGSTGMRRIYLLAGPNTILFLTRKDKRPIRVSRCRKTLNGRASQVEHRKGVVMNELPLATLSDVLMS
jgi:hypothetical protein